MLAGKPASVHPMAATCTPWDLGEGRVLLTSEAHFRIQEVGIINEAISGGDKGRDRNKAGRCDQEHLPERLALAKGFG